MNININETLINGLSLLTYNQNSIIMPKDNQLNIYMGLGLWSVRDGLSEGLPIDVMQMLLSATMMRSKIKEANRDESPKIIILIADSMAVREGAEKEKVSCLIHIYKKSLEPLLQLLNIKECSEIILSSELECLKQYEEAVETVEGSSIVKQLKIEDEAHYDYIRAQTAITRYMNIYRNVGIKVGWICAESSKQLSGCVSPQSLNKWDELKFDRWCEDVCKDSTMQYLYAKAGLRQTGSGKHVSDGKNVNVTEGCPYTAYARDQRYIIQTQNKRDIKSICPIQKRVAAHWKGIAEVCSSLMRTCLVHSQLLPEDCIKKNNAKATLYTMLNHWTNSPLLLKHVFCEDSTPHSLSVYGPSGEGSYSSHTIPEMTLVKSIQMHSNYETL